MFRIILGSFLMLSSTAQAEVYGTTCLKSDVNPIIYNVIADLSKNYVKLHNEQGSEIVLNIQAVHISQSMVVVSAVSSEGNVIAVHFSLHHNVDSLLRYDVKANKYITDKCGEAIH